MCSDARRRRVTNFVSYGNSPPVNSKNTKSGGRPTHSDTLKIYSERSRCQNANTELGRCISTRLTAGCDKSPWACSGMCLCVCSSGRQVVEGLNYFALIYSWFGSFSCRPLSIQCKERDVYVGTVRGGEGCNDDDY